MKDPNRGYMNESPLDRKVYRRPLVYTTGDLAYNNGLPILNMSGTENLYAEIAYQMRPGAGSAMADSSPVYYLNPNISRYDHTAELMPYFYKNPGSRGDAPKAPLFMGGYSRVDGVNSQYLLRSGRI